MNGIAADVFALYLKDEEFSLAHERAAFSRQPILLDEQADQLYAMTDPIVERIRKPVVRTLRSIGHIARGPADQG